MAASMARQVARRAKEKTVLRLCMVLEETKVRIQKPAEAVKDCCKMKRTPEGVLDESNTYRISTII